MSGDTRDDNADRMPDEALADATDALLAHIASLPEGSSVSREGLMGSDAYQRANLALSAVDDHDFRIADIRAELKAHGYIATLWHVDDVTDIRPDLTGDQAMHLLEDLDANQEIILETVKHDVISDMADTTVFDTVQPDAAAELEPAQPEMDAP